MIVSFDTEKFRSYPRGLIEILSDLHRVGSWSSNYNKEIESITCRTPASALRYCQNVTYSFGISPEAEEVFLKNPNIGLRYLNLVRREKFLDEKVQKRFWKKVVKKPDLAYFWANQFKKRLSESEEEVFIENPSIARNYAFFVIKGAFPEKIHQMLVLKSFEDLTEHQKRMLQEYLKYAESFLRKSSSGEIKV